MIFICFVFQVLNEHSGIVMINKIKFALASEVHHQSIFLPLSKGRSGGDCKQEGFSRNNLRISGFKGWFIKATQIDLVNAQVYEFQSTHPHGGGNVPRSSEVNNPNKLQALQINVFS